MEPNPWPLSCTVTDPLQKEQDRLDFQHAMFTLALDGRLALAPMQDTPKHVIDVATGTGIWADSFGT